MKKIVMIVLTVALCAAMLVSCAAPAAAPSASASASASVAANESAAPSAAAAGDYMAWTKADWDAATDDQKLEASYVLIGELSGALFEGIDMKTLIEQAKTDEKAKAQMDESAKQMFQSVDGFFEEKPEMTLQDMINMINQSMG